MAVGKFGNKAAAPGKFGAKPGAAKAPPPPAKKKSRYAGIPSAAPRDPMPHVGEYRLRVIGNTAGHNEGTGTDSYKSSLEIVGLDEKAAENHAEGDQVIVVQLTSGKAAKAGLPRVKAYVMAAAGYETDEEYDAFDPEGEFIDSTEGQANQYSAADLTIVGRLVDCKVTRGKNTPDGDDYYREFHWSVVPEDEQDAVGKVGE